MVMNEYEIYKSYIEAKNQKSQLSILADLNDVPRKEISKIIERQQNLEKEKAKLPKKAEITQKKPQFEEIESRLEILDALISKYTEEYLNLSKMIGARCMTEKRNIYT